MTHGMENISINQSGGATMSRQEKTVTQADIAREVNTSIVTVSNALSGKKGVNHELRQKILDVAEEMGYKKRKTKREKKEAESYNLGVIISERYLKIMPSFYMKVYQEIVIAATKKDNFTLLEVLSATSEKNLEIPDLIVNGEVDGILVLGELKHPYMRLLKERSTVPIIFVDYYEDLSDTDFIITSGYFGTYQITKILLEAGYEKIAFVGTLGATSSITDRYMGYRRALLESDIEVEKKWVIKDRKMWDDLIEIELPAQMPEAFVCNCDRTASVLIKKLYKKGYRIPDDIAVTGFDHYLMEDIGDIELLTYDVDIEAIAQVSVNTIIRKIEHTHFIPRLRIIEGSVIRGNSFKNKNK